MNTVKQNTEILINESHTNKYMFVLNRIPTSYLLSKFASDQSVACLNLLKQKIIDPTTNMYDKDVINKLGNLDSEFIIEQNNDVRNFTLYLQSVSIPGLDLEYTTNSTPYADIKHIEGKLKFANLEMVIMNDENWFMWKMLNAWLMAGHNPAYPMKFTEYEYYKNFYVSGSLIILDNHYQKVLELEFEDLHPVSLPQIEMKDSEAGKIIMPVEWVYTYYTPSDRIVIKRV